MNRELKNRLEKAKYLSRTRGADGELKYKYARKKKAPTKKVDSFDDELESFRAQYKAKKAGKHSAQKLGDYSEAMLDRKDPIVNPASTNKLKDEKLNKKLDAVKKKGHKDKKKEEAELRRIAKEHGLDEEDVIQKYYDVHLHTPEVREKHKQQERGHVASGSGKKKVKDFYAGRKKES